MQAYQGMDFEKAMSLTLPQIFMLNDGSDVNHKRAEEHYEWKKKTEEQAKARAPKTEADPIVPEFGKRFSELNSDEVAAYNNRALRFRLNNVRTFGSEDNDAILREVQR